ncbi:hypothetical protein JT235_00935 [Helicobacter pylori]|nr:hypothetical protein [Helicobacter pylori]
MRVKNDANMNKHKAIKPSSLFLSKIAKLILSPLSNAIKIAAKIPRIATKSLFVLSIYPFMVLVWFVMLLISSLRFLGFVASKIKDYRLTIIRLFIACVLLWR